MRIEGWKLELKTTRAEHIKPREDFSYYLNSAMEKQQERVNKESLPVDARISAKVEEVSQKYGIPKELIYAIIKQESNFNPKAYNKNKDGTEDRGLMQVNYQHNLRLMREYGITDPNQLFDIETNIELGARILYENFQRFGNWAMAVKAYNGLKADNWDYVRGVFEKLALFR
ncbi:lytic transglycosylase domain-containing protein [Hydrogenobacter sp. T-2]|uniref:lytic transglycosylase domain-containing protein n=1 Tax=Pampinifervens diazotrophicum TaxID=1632018 RepID=UPI002B25D8C7|nr:lytic transglycosylase domain-containing protein [Hydrogenobacter sp. T-2]WPM32573.1 lytic transglycosylase domain-containing protein [Hydrogenobacter sp. T-2]